MILSGSNLSMDDSHGHILSNFPFKLLFIYQMLLETLKCVDFTMK